MAYIAATICGHTHTRKIARWNGTKDDRVTEGLPFLNTDNAAHFGGPTQAFLYVEVHAEDILVRELATKDAWKTAAWTDLSWRLPHYTG